MDRTTNGRVRVEPDLQGSEGERTLLGVAIEQNDGGVVLRLSGEIDLSSISALAAAISAHETDLRVLDLREITFIDCGGMQALIDATARARAGRRRLSILPGPALLHLTGLTHQQGVLDLATHAERAAGAPGNPAPPVGVPRPRRPGPSSPER